LRDIDAVKMRQALPVETGRRLSTRLAKTRSAVAKVGITPTLWWRVLGATILLTFLMAATNGLRASLVGRIADRIAVVLFVLTFIVLLWISFLGLVKWLEGLGAKRQR
jgi:hypothetical protein